MKASSIRTKKYRNNKRTAKLNKSLNYRNGRMRYSLFERNGDGGSTNIELSKKKCIEIVKVLQKDFGLKHFSKVVDFGSGFGETATVIQQCANCLVVGVEVSKTVHTGAMICLRETVKRVVSIQNIKERKPVLYFPINEDIANLTDMGGAQLVFTNLAAAGREAMEASARAFNRDKECQYLLCVMEKDTGIDPLKTGFNVKKEPVHNFGSCRLRDSTSSRLVHLYKKDTSIAPLVQRWRKGERNTIVKEAFKTLWQMRNNPKYTVETQLKEHKIKTRQIIDSM